MANISHIDFNFVCRTCMQQVTNGKNLFTTTYQTFSFVEMFDKCTASIVSQDDGLPVNVCEECASKLVSFFEFRVQISTSEITFRQILSDEAFSKTNAIEIKKELEVSVDESVLSTASAEFVFNKISADEFVLSDGFSDREEEIIVKNEQEKSCSEKKLPKERRKRSTKTDFENLYRKKYERKTFECFYCHRILDNFNCLLKHIQTHGTINPVDEKTSNLKDSESKPNGSKTAKGYLCEYCPEMYGTINNILRHLKTHTNLKEYSCSECPRIFYLNIQFKKHLKCHETSKHVCEVCNQTFAVAGHLNKHKLTHKENLCTLCGKSNFKNAKSWYGHMNRHRAKENQKRMACSECPKILSTRQAFRRHMQTHLQRENRKQYVCEICSSSFTTNSSLDKHKRYHTDDRRYPCTICPKRFFTNSHLIQHIRTHTGEKPFKCEYCDRSFSQRNDMKKHLRVHIGENIHRCTYKTCSSAFRYHADREAHLAEHFRLEKASQSSNHQTTN